MALESFFYFNYFSSVQSFKPMIIGIPFTYTEKNTSQSAELTAFKHSIVNFGNYVFVNPMRMSLSGVRFDVDYMIKKPEIFLSGLLESQKISPSLYIDADYNGAVFLEDWSCSKGNSDILGTYTLNFRQYNIDLLNAFGNNDVQLSSRSVVSDELKKIKIATSR